jgi:hypothetical protein
VEHHRVNGLFGGPFSTHARRASAWEQALRIPGCDKAEWRCDAQGRVIRWSDYGDRLSGYGWTIDRTRGEGWLASALGVVKSKPIHMHEADPFGAEPRGSVARGRRHAA